MSWLSSGIFPYRSFQRTGTLVKPAITTAGTMFLVGTIVAGFLGIVGVRSTSLLLAAVPVLAGLGFLLCHTLGSAWQGLTAENTHPDVLMPPESSLRLAGKGLALMAFYGCLGTFLVAITLLFYPYGLILPILCVLFHPLLASPVFFTAKRHDMSFIGLFDACLDVGRFLRGHYGATWVQASCYLIVWGMGVYPILLGVLTVSGIGIFLVPGCCQAFLTGYGHLLSRCYQDILAEEAAWQAAGQTLMAASRRNPFELANPVPVTARTTFYDFQREQRLEPIHRRDLS